MNPTGWFRDTINRAALTGRDGAGNRTYGAPGPVLVKAEIEINMILKGPGGEERYVRDRFFAPVAFNEFDQLFLPGDGTSDPSLARYVAKVWPRKQKDGTIRFWEVWT